MLVREPLLRGIGFLGDLSPQEINKLIGMWYVLEFHLKSFVESGKFIMIVSFRLLGEVRGLQNELEVGLHLMQFGRMKPRQVRRALRHCYCVRRNNRELHNCVFYYEEGQAELFLVLLGL